MIRKGAFSKRTVLILSSKYASEANCRYLTNDLIECLNEHYRVISLAYSDRNLIRISNDGDRIELLIGLSSNLKYIKYFAAWFRLFFLAIYASIKYKVDSIIVFAPLTVLWPALVVFSFFSIRKSLCIVFDIFPTHQVQIVAIPSWLEKILVWVESALISKFVSVSGMTEKNIERIKSVYFSGRVHPRFLTLPPWGAQRLFDHITIKKRVHEIRTKRELRFVFGGQIGKGRSIDFFIKMIEAVAARGYSVTLDVFADPNGRDYIHTIGSKVITIHVLDYLPREDYLKQLACYDFGIVATDSRVDIPTFPSKIVDYVSSGLRCICILESSSDIYSIVPFKGLLHVNHFDLDKKALDALEEFISGDDYFEQSEKIVLILSSGAMASKVMEVL